MRSDLDLLSDFTERGDEAAFAGLAGRYGAMVYRTCLRLLVDPHSAEDAAQATFVVLARRAGKLRFEGSLAAWLHGVARRVSSEAIRSRLRRTRHEQEAGMARSGVGENAETGREAVAADLDRELGRLPSVLQQAVMLRYLEGHSQQDSAMIAGCPQGTLAWRASEGLERLRRRLSSGRAAFSGAALIALLETEAQAAVPPKLLPFLLDAATLAASGAAEASGGTALMLAEAAMKAAVLSKVKVGVCMLAGALMLACGVSLALRAVGGEEVRPKSGVGGRIKGEDPDEAYWRSVRKYAESKRKLLGAATKSRGIEPTKRPPFVSAAESALGWLSRTQEADGHWDSAKYGAEPADDVGATAAAVLGFLGAGYTEKVAGTHPRYPDCVRRGLDWLARQQREDGSLGDTEMARFFGPIVLTEAYGMTKLASRRGPALKALNWLRSSERKPGSITNPGLAWTITSARVGGLLPRRPEGIQADMASTFEKRSPWSFDKVESSLPSEMHDYTQTMRSYLVGGATWKNWSSKLKAKLISSQGREGEQAGSWRGSTTAASKNTGRVLATALNMLSLSVYYRYLPVSREGRPMPARESDKRAGEGRKGKTPEIF